ncbi:MAG: ABC transporter substrate-binding protein [Pelagibacterium sp.]|uniref:ABC transporter substrate-binding protein n=1 Tax=Pelagibacterium sp. TaxID=1967288 RepID=UPI0032EF990E
MGTGRKTKVHAACLAAACVLTTPTLAAEATFGFSGWAVGYLPTAIAIDRLNEMGHEVDAVELGGNNNQLQAAATGNVDITAIAQVMDAIDQGFDTRFFLAGNSNEFLLVARSGLDSCESLEGQALGIHSVGSFVGQLALQWLAATCPETNANITVIEGSDNRLAALVAGQLDASVIDLQDWALLQQAMPGAFEVTSDYTKTLPIMRAAFAAPPAFIEANPELIEDWITVHLDVYQEIYENPQLLVEKGLEVLGEIDPEVLPQIVDAFVAAEIWPVDGGPTDASVQATIDFFDNDGEPFETISAPADVVDRTILDAVLSSR